MKQNKEENCPESLGMTWLDLIKDETLSKVNIELM